MKTNNYRPVINDICRNIEDFDRSSIYWIDNVTVSEDHPLSDRLSSLVKDKDDKIIFAQAGAITDSEPAKGSIIEAKKLIDEESKILYDSGFYNIVFNRCMGKSYGLYTIFIYGNTAGEKFIDDYMTEDSIINRINFESQTRALKASNLD